MADFNIISVDAQNVEDYGFFCVRNTKHPGYRTKLSWLQKRFHEGLTIKLILTRDGEQAGFLEYIPGEYTWRTIEAAGYLVIHCIWVKSGKFSFSGMASALLRNCLKDAQSGGKDGVAVVTSDGPWMAGKGVFMKNGFEQVDEAPPYYQLLIKPNGKEPLPTFPRNWEARLSQGSGLQLLYINQCPYIGKAVNELPPVAEKYGMKLHLVELKNSDEARQRMPSPYGVFSLVYDGRLLVDHPISTTRFKNILEKELKLKIKG
jgi:ribosomal protein S18 acetylase RimI-like enzyme